jgi:hypothetical protein
VANKKLKKQKRRAEKRAKYLGEPLRSPAEELLARIALERRVRHERNAEDFREEQERLWLAEERRRARQEPKAEGRKQKQLRQKAKGES